jgi:hypothetical protein
MLLGASWLGDQPDLCLKKIHEDDGNPDKNLETASASRRHITYSVQGLGQFLLDLKRLYAAFMNVRLQFQENQDQNAIMKAASFLSRWDEFSDRYKISQVSQPDRLTGKAVEYDRLNMKVVSFLHLPDWICPKYTLFQSSCYC